MTTWKQKQTGGGDGEPARSDLYRNGLKVLRDAKNQACWFYAITEGKRSDIYEEEWFDLSKERSTVGELIESALSLHQTMCLEEVLEKWRGAYEEARKNVLA